MILCRVLRQIVPGVQGERTIATELYFQRASTPVWSRGRLSNEENVRAQLLGLSKSAHKTAHGTAMPRGGSSERGPI